jgi:hypothetical protein
MAHRTEDGGLRSDVRGRSAWRIGRGRRSDVGGQRAEDGKGWRSEDGGQRAEDGGLRSGVGGKGLKSEVGGREGMIRMRRNAGIKRDAGMLGCWDAGMLE